MQWKIGENSDGVEYYGIPYESIATFYDTHGQGRLQSMVTGILFAKGLNRIQLKTVQEVLSDSMMEWLNE